VGAGVVGGFAFGGAGACSTALVVLVHVDGVLQPIVGVVLSVVPDPRGIHLTVGQVYFVQHDFDFLLHDVVFVLLLLNRLHSAQNLCTLNLDFVLHAVGLNVHHRQHVAYARHCFGLLYFATTVLHFDRIVRFPLVFEVWRGLAFVVAETIYAQALLVESQVVRKFDFFRVESQFGGRFGEFLA